NIEIERLPDDVTTFFGAGSREDNDVRAALALPDTPGNQPARQKPNTDYLGIAIHCAQGSPLCRNRPAMPDQLPAEPGDDDNFKVLLGNINVQPVISPGGPVKDLDGNVIQDAYGQPGFPNIFNPRATQSLGYAATMLEAGVPVVYVYIADAWSRRSRATRSEEHTSELQSLTNLVCRLLLAKTKLYFSAPNDDVHRTIST